MALGVLSVFAGILCSPPIVPVALDFIWNIDQGAEIIIDVKYHFVNQ